MATRKLNDSLPELKIIINHLQTGEVSLVGQAMRGSNSTFLVNVAKDSKILQAIYKPSKGERPLWDFPNFTLAQREVAAFIVSLLLGWHFVPPTVLRTKPVVFGSGSLQLFIQHNPKVHYLNSEFTDELILMKIVIFDHLINNADRKSGHIIFDENQKPWLIDHGLSFNCVNKHRSVVWEFTGLPLPEEIKSDLELFINHLILHKLRLVKKLSSLLSKQEYSAIIRRGSSLLEQGFFPSPEPDRRSYPWPPI